MERAVAEKIKKNYENPQNQNLPEPKVKKITWLNLIRTQMHGELLQIRRENKKKNEEIALRFLISYRFFDSLNPSYVWCCNAYSHQGRGNPPFRWLRHHYPHW